MEQNSWMKRGSEGKHAGDVGSLRILLEQTGFWTQGLTVHGKPNIYGTTSLPKEASGLREILTGFSTTSEEIILPVTLHECRQRTSKRYKYDEGLARCLFVYHMSASISRHRNTNSVPGTKNVHESMFGMRCIDASLLNNNQVILTIPITYGG